MIIQFGIVLNKKVSDIIEKGEVVATIYANDEQKANIAKGEFRNAYKVQKEKVEKPKHIIEIIE